MVIRITSREYDVLSLLNYSKEKIAEELNIAIGTVNVIYTKLAKKFNAQNRTDLVIKALKYGAIELDAFKIVY